MLPTPADAIGLFARSRPDRIAARDLVSGERWTYAEFDDAIARLACHLIARGCRPGDRVAVLARNSVGQVKLHFACARAGLIYVPLNWRLSPVELSALIERSAPTIVLADEQSRPLLVDNPAVESIAAFLDTARIAAPLYDVARDPERPSLILFTSGTSGQPKGVVLSERNLQQTAINFSMMTDVSADSCFLCESPMFHVIGLVTNIRPVFQQGGSIAVSDGFEPQRTLDWLSDQAMGISHYVGVPQMIEGFRQQPNFDVEKLRHMTAIVTGGAPHAPQDIAAWLDDGISLVSGFGMSEAGTVFGMPTDIAVIRQKLGSAGLASPFMEVRLVDGDERDCPPGEPGELLLRGDNILAGYWQDREQTDKAFAEGGWFRTGDIARCDEEGFFWIVDRKKDMFISGGENVYPAEIEHALDGYPGIREVALVGIPDAKWGEVGCLVLVPEAGVGVEESSLLDFLGQRLSRYKLPKRIVIADAIPRTATGKIQKAELRKQVLGEA